MDGRDRHGSDSRRLVDRLPDVVAELASTFDRAEIGSTDTLPLAGEACLTARQIRR